MPSDDFMPCDVIHSVQFNSAWGILSCLRCERRKPDIDNILKIVNNGGTGIPFILSPTFSFMKTTISINILKFKGLRDCSFSNLVMKSAEYLGTFQTIFILPNPLTVMRKKYASVRCYLKLFM